MTSNKRKRVVITIEQKLEVIQKFEDGASVRSLVDHYSVGEQTIRDIIKNKNKIIEFGASNSVKGVHRRKSMKLSTYEALDKAMVLWLNQQWAEGIPVSGTACTSKARYFFDELGLQGSFNASTGWLKRFKQRHGIRQITIREGETPSSNASIAEDFVNEFKKFIVTHKLDPRQIYNADETGLYWKCFLSKTHETENKTQKERLTVLCCANAAGSHFLKPCVIGTDGKPSEFEDTSPSNLPVHYYNNKSAWMDREVFSIWFKNDFIPSVSHYLSSEGLPQKAVLLLDNAPSHHNEKLLNSDNENIFIIYLPPNDTALIQPMAQGIFQNLKEIYRKNLLTKREIENCDLLTFWKELTILDAMYEISEAWKSINGEAIKNSWSKILPRNDEEDIKQEKNNEDFLPEMLNKFRHINGCEDVNDQLVQDWIDSDKNLAGHEVLTDYEILECVTTELKQTNEDARDEEMLISPMKIAHLEALTHVDKILQYLEQQDDSSMSEMTVVKNIRNKILLKETKTNK